MKKKSPKQNEHKMVKEVRHDLMQREDWATLFGAVSSLALALSSVLLAILGWKIGTSEKLPVIVPIVIGVFALMGLIAIIIQMYNNKRMRDFEADYIYYEQSKRISTALLSSIKRIDFDKTCSILQSTYGHVPEWNPIDYCKNVLVYDIHQHLRSICIRLKELIISLAPDEFNDDTVTVDMAFTYPSDHKMIVRDIGNSRCQIDSIPNQSDSAEKSDWKIITSGDNTSSNNSLHVFLDEESTSFYNYLKSEYYAFYNDKKTAASQNRYIWSKKDMEYERVGSIVGKVIELNNDMPEMTYVRVLLTITTYGRKLVEDYDPLDVDRFKHLFTETVMNNYKSLIEAELAQMFIRHGIRDRYIDRANGMLKIDPQKMKSGHSKDQ